MKLKTKLMMFTAAAALSANMAFAQAAIDPQSLADAYLAEGYSYVEVEVGPTQTKIAAVKGDTKVEVIYDNATGAIIKQESELADQEYLGRTGIEIDQSDEDFEDGGDDDEGDDAEDDEGDDDGEDDDGEDDDSEDDDSDEGSDDSGDDSGDDNDDSDSDSEGDDD